ncbi:hypothetical protein [Thalassobacillus devorans]|uniref:hypothetical protein n=1 Tax=Thalassobacillus devorans TaxID=279813 RepID=UPI0004B3B0E4|nr:hypothetical protein [Thalassobacillus devorans]
MYPIYYPYTPYYQAGHEYYPYMPRRYPEKPAYPPVDSSLFSDSAAAMEKLLDQASLVLRRLAESKTFAHDVMQAAQVNDMKKVDALLKSTGIHSGVQTKVNPDGINLQLTSEVEGVDCCHLTIALRWRI